jgi:isopenicillin N synthase-like dioxygenase
MEEFYSDMVRISKALVRAFSSGYGYDEEYLSGFCERGDTISVMRLFHYFPYHKADEAYPDQHDRIGSSAHTDWGFLTLIVQEPGVTGLQLFQEDRWMDVPPVDGTLLVNCGDYFSLLTGGVYKSPLHRVISEGKERSSAVLFYYPDYEARIPVLARQNYSLFENQAELHPTDGNIDPADTPFGEYIHNKWEQVQRAASHPQK